MAKCMTEKVIHIHLCGRDVQIWHRKPSRASDGGSSSMVLHGTHESDPKPPNATESLLYALTW